MPLFLLFMVQHPNVYSHGFTNYRKSNIKKMALARYKRGLLHCRPNRSVQVKMKKVRAQASNIARDICFIINGHHSKDGMLYCDFAKVG